MRSSTPAGRVVVPPGADPEQPPAGAEPPGQVEDVEIEDPGDLAALQDERYQSWVWYIWRQPAPGEARDKTAPTKGPRYVAKLYGPLDVEDVRAQCGGGHYKICGYVAGTKQRGFMLTIDGPPRVAPIVPPPGSAPAPAAVPASAPSSELGALTQQLTRVVDQLTQLAQREPPQTPPGQVFGFKEFLQLLPFLQGEQRPPIDSGMLKEMIGLVTTGIDLGRNQDGGANPWLAVIDRLGPHLDRIAANMQARQRTAGRRPAAPGGPPPSPGPAASGSPVAPPAPAPAAVQSEAVVVDETEDADRQRWAVAVESLARAITDEQDPGDFAGVLEHILSDGQLSMLVSASTDAVMAELAQVQDRFPVFGTPAARSFVDAVLGELRAPPQEDEASPPS